MSSTSIVRSITMRCARLAVSVLVSTSAMRVKCAPVAAKSSLQINAMDQKQAQLQVPGNHTTHTHTHTDGLAHTCSRKVEHDVRHAVRVEEVPDGLQLAFLQAAAVVLAAGAQLCAARLDVQGPAAQRQGLCWITHTAVEPVEMPRLCCNTRGGCALCCALCEPAFPSCSEAALPCCSNSPSWPGRSRCLASAVKHTHCGLTGLASSKLPDPGLPGCA